MGDGWCGWAHWKQVFPSLPLFSFKYKGQEWSSAEIGFGIFYFPFASQFYVCPGLQYFGNTAHQLETLPSDISRADGMYMESLV